MTFQHNQEDPHLLDFDWYQKTYIENFLPSIGGEANSCKSHLFIPIGYTDATSCANQSIKPIDVADARLIDKALEDPENWIL